MAASRDSATKSRNAGINTDDEFNFQSASSEDDAQVPGVSYGALASPQLIAKRYTKLEVVNARQIEFLLRWQYLFIGIGALYTLVVVVLVNTVFMQVLRTPKEQGWLFDMRAYLAPKWMLWLNHVGVIVIFLFALILTFVYGLRILSRKRSDVTHEQAWVVFLLIFITLYNVPIIELRVIHDFLLPPSLVTGATWASQPWWKVAVGMAQVAMTAGFSGCTIFYVWANVHSYRLLENRADFRFYLHKIIPLMIYVATKVTLACLTQHRILCAALPLANLTGMLSLYYTANRWDKVGVWAACVVTLIDLGFIICIGVEQWQTKLVLKNADYLKYRSKQIGFRFFMYHNITFYTIYTSLYITLQLGLPNGVAVWAYVTEPPKTSVFRTHSFGFGLKLMMLAYAWTEAYVNLPADALGFRGWFTAQPPKGVGADTTELEPITYRKREPPSLHGVVSDVNINCFVMQTHVTMFNFAWLVYYWDTPKVDNFKLTQDVFKFSIAEYIKDAPTDTHVIVVDGEDRIVIAFKGTTSLKNLKTDVSMLHTALRTLMPTPRPDGSGGSQTGPAPAAAALVDSRIWRRAMVHQGFSIAYGAIAPRLLAVLSDLQAAKRRPVFLTGHSLGGALATVCSLDLFVALGLTRREIFVSTFGSPRVGNRAFRELYDESVPVHWRMVVGPDVVAKLPKVGYAHAGKKVLITVDGDLFMDPNSLELNLWSGDSASILYHRKASYLLAMRAWCERHHGDEYVPEFWPFPVSKDDTKRFQHAMVKAENNAFNAIGGGKLDKKTKLLQYDAMIDKLDSQDDNYEPTPRSVQNWARLANKLLDQGPPIENSK